MAVNKPIGNAMAEAVSRVNGNKSKDDIIEGLLREIRELKRRLAARDNRVPPNSTEPDIYLTCKDVAERLRISMATVNRWCNQGKIDCEWCQPTTGVPYWKINPDQVFPRRYSRKLKTSKES